MTFTFDIGMLVALARRKRRATEAFRNIVRRGFLPIVPAVVYAEWWRGRSDIREEILADAIVMASAALRGGGIVYTSDVRDLNRLTRHFPTVLVLHV